MKKVCCRCRLEKKGDLWVSGAGRDSHKVSYGFCPSCYHAALAEIERACISRGRRKDALVGVV